MPVYRCTGVDRDSGEPRSGLINARSSEAAIKAANEIGLIVEDVTELPGPSKPQCSVQMNIADQIRVAFWGIAGVLLGGLIAVVRIAGANALVGGGILNNSAVFWSIVAVPAMIGGAFGLIIGILMVLVSSKPR